MEKALNNPENSERVGLNGKMVAEKYFNKDVQAKKLFKFFKELNLNNVD